MARKGVYHRRGMHLCMTCRLRGRSGCFVIMNIKYLQYIHLAWIFMEIHSFMEIMANTYGEHLSTLYTVGTLYTLYLQGFDFINS